MLASAAIITEVAAAFVRNGIGRGLAVAAGGRPGGGVDARRPAAARRRPGRAAPAALPDGDPRDAEPGRGAAAHRASTSATRADAEEAASALHASGPQWVLVKGGHLHDDPDVDRSALRRHRLRRATRQADRHPAHPRRRRLPGRGHDRPRWRAVGPCRGGARTASATSRRRSPTPIRWERAWGRWATCVTGSRPSRHAVPCELRTAQSPNEGRDRGDRRRRHRWSGAPRSRCGGSAGRSRCTSGPSIRPRSVPASRCGRTRCTRWTAWACSRRCELGEVESLGGARTDAAAG